MAETKRIDVVFEGTGRATGKMRNDISVHWPAQGERFELATDEGPFHGGDGTAPPPLALFTAALTGCLMTQIRAFARRMRIDLSHVEVHARLHWYCEAAPGEPYVSHPVGFELDVEMESDAPLEDRLRLLEAAKNGCFLERTLSKGLEIVHRLRHGEDWIDA